MARVSWLDDGLRQGLPLSNVYNSRLCGLERAMHLLPQPFQPAAQPALMNAPQPMLRHHSEMFALPYPPAHPPNLLLWGAIIAPRKLLLLRHVYYPGAGNVQAPGPSCMVAMPAQRVGGPPQRTFTAILAKAVSFERPATNSDHNYQVSAERGGVLGAGKE